MTERPDPGLPALKQLRGQFEELAGTPEAAGQAPSRKRIALATSAVMLVAGGSVAALTTLTDRQEVGPTRTALRPAESMKEIYVFESLPQLIATSDLVVDATVERIMPGRIYGGGGQDSGEPVPEGETELEATGAVQASDVTLSVNQVLYVSDSGDSLAELTLEEFGDAGPESAVHSIVGDRGVYFLARDSKAPERVTLLNSQSVFLQSSEGTLLSASDAPWVVALQDLTLEGLGEAVRTAAVPVTAGAVEPARPLVSK